MDDSLWRIGDGERVRIGLDRWLPDNPGFLALGPSGCFEKADLVKELIDEDLRCWKRDLINNNFSLSEALQIVSIPLSVIQNEDKLIWHYERDGEYSVCI